MSLIPRSELLAAYERIEKAAEAAPAVTGFKYQPRTRAQWYARMDQMPERSVKTKSRVAQEWAQRAEQAKQSIETTAPAVADAGTPGKKVSGRTVCLCGHKRTGHCTGNPKLHENGWCRFEHCECSTWDGKEMRPCACAAFQAFEGAPVKQKHPKADDWTKCQSCGHRKADHCTKAKPGKAARLKSGEMAYRILSTPDGTSYGCKHFDPANPACQCDSTSCSHTADGKTFCPCERYVNPLARPRAKAAKPRKMGQHVETLEELKQRLAQMEGQL